MTFAYVLVAGSPGVPDVERSTRVRARLRELFERHRAGDAARLDRFYDSERGYYPPEEAGEERDRRRQRTNTHAVRERTVQDEVLFVVHDVRAHVVGGNRARNLTGRVPHGQEREHRTADDVVGRVCVCPKRFLPHLERMLVTGSPDRREIEAHGPISLGP